MLAQLWANFPGRLTKLQLHSFPPKSDSFPPKSEFAGSSSAEHGADETETSDQSAAAAVLRALKNATRLAEVEVQLTALTAMARLFEGFAKGDEQVHNYIVFVSISYLYIYSSIHPSILHTDMAGLFEGFAKGADEQVHL